MYEGDAPLAERRAAALALDRDLLRELLGAEELRELLDPGVLADLELELQCLTDGRRAAQRRRAARRAAPARRPRRRPRSTCGCEGAERGRRGSAELVAERRAIEVRIGGEERFVAAEDAARYRDALGCALPLGLPMAFTEPVPRPLEQLVARYARTHGPFLADDVARRFGVAARAGRRRAAPRSRPTDRVVRGEFRPDGVEREWCDVEVLRQLRRRSLAALRREVEPVEQEALARFLPAWHGIPAPAARPRGAGRGARRCCRARRSSRRRSRREVLAGAGARLPAADLDELCTSGDLVWVGAGALGARDGRVRLCFRDQLAAARRRG